MDGINYEQYVLVGMAALDEEVPNWRSSINFDKLDISTQNKCALGQIFGSYPDAPDKLILESTSLGFDLPDIVPDSANRKREYQKLNNAWRELVVQVR